MSSSTAYIGTGTTLSSTYYVRNFYQSNRTAATSSKRRELSSTDLSLADSHAMRKALRQLGSSDFSESQDTNVRNKVLAYIETYNNMLSSAADSSDHTLERSAKQLKNITKEYSSMLDKIGVTVNDDGTLTGRETLLKSASLSKFEELFSNNSDYMQRTTAYAKRLVSRSEALSNSAKQKTASARNADSAASDPADTDNSTTAAAQLLSEMGGADALLPSGVGENVNVVL